MACSLSADRDIICRTKTITSLTIRGVFNLDRHRNSSIRWLVPVFQRRYCWGKEQVGRLISDSIKLCSLSESDSLHPLGRIVVHYQAAGNILLVDGQQRLTTTSIFLSAIRDFILKILHLHTQSPAHESLQHLVELCHETIYSSKHQHTILEPSYYDRASYAMCVNYESRDEEKFLSALNSAATPLATPASGTTDTTDHADRAADILMVDQILKNRAHFDTVLANGSLCDSIAQKLNMKQCGTDVTLGLNCSIQNLEILTSVCRSLINAVLDSFTVLYFETQEDDICSVYERLAMREAALAKGFSNSNPGITLAEADLARNLITSFGCDDSAQIDLYQRYWAPLEQKAEEVNRLLSVTLPSSASSVANPELSTTISESPSSGMFPRLKSQFVKIQMPKKGNIASSHGPKHSPASGMTEHLRACLQAFMDRRQLNADLSGSRKKHQEASGPPTITNKSKNTLDPGAQWMDPGEALFPMYSSLKTCVRGALESNNLPIAMHAPTPDAEAVVSSLLAELLIFATEEYNWESSCQ